MKNNKFELDREELGKTVEFLNCVINSKSDILEEFGYDQEDRIFLIKQVEKYDKYLSNPTLDKFKNDINEIYNSKLILEEFLEIQKNIKKLFQMEEYLIRTTKLIGCTIIVLLLLC